MTDKFVVTDWVVFYLLEESPPVFYREMPADIQYEIERANPGQTELSEEEENAFVSLMVRSPWSNLYGKKRVMGFFRIVGDRLFRALAEEGCTPTWDVSVRAPDGTYDFHAEGRAMDEIWSLDSNKIAFLAPAGFPKTLRAAEEHIKKYLETLNEA